MSEFAAAFGFWAAGFCIAATLVNFLERKLMWGFILLGCAGFNIVLGIVNLNNF